MLVFYALPTPNQRKTHTFEQKMIQILFLKNNDLFYPIFVGPLQEINNFFLCLNGVQMANSTRKLYIAQMSPSGSGSIAMLIYYSKEF